MKRLAIVLSGIAIWAFASPDLWAQYQFGGPDNYFNACGCYPQIPNDSPGTYYLTLPNGPSATEDGAIWLNTGSGPALKSGNIAVSIYYENTSAAWQLEETMFATDGGYAGYFFATADPTWGDSRMISNPMIVSTETIPCLDLQSTLQTFQQGLFYLQFWSDPTLESTGTSAYSSYAKAFAASETGTPDVYVAQSAPFKVDFGLGGLMPLLYANEMGMYMPAVVLQTATFPGDANRDGRVDINDLTVVLANYNKTGMTWSQGEFTGSGTVDINDLTIVLANYNQTVGASGLASSSAVPEPSALLLAAAALAGCLASVGRRYWRR